MQILKLLAAVADHLPERAVRNARGRHGAAEFDQESAGLRGRLDAPGRRIGRAEEPVRAHLPRLARLLRPLRPRFLLRVGPLEAQRADDELRSREAALWGLPNLDPCILRVPDVLVEVLKRRRASRPQRLGPLRGLLDDVLLHELEVAPAEVQHAVDDRVERLDEVLVLPLAGADELPRVGLLPERAEELPVPFRDVGLEPAKHFLEQWTRHLDAKEGVDAREDGGHRAGWPLKRHGLVVVFPLVSDLPRLDQGPQLVEEHVVVAQGPLGLRAREHDWEAGPS
mmetsp:Transcript_11006/g.27011  ORF Transcript_11006/g.27011 Transcript_11006/m.27011 type:complete len:283 (+) Transcript_11006:1450-2298(+)